MERSNLVGRIHYHDIFARSVDSDSLYFAQRPRDSLGTIQHFPVCDEITGRLCVDEDWIIILVIHSLAKEPSQVVDFREIGGKRFMNHNNCLEERLIVVGNSF